MVVRETLVTGSQSKFGESKFVWLMVSIFYVESMVLPACFVERKEVSTKMEKS